MRAILDLLAAHADEWLTIGQVRDALGMDVHQLPGALSTFPRRWRGRYCQAGPLPFGVEGKGSRRRHRVGQEVAELVTSLMQACTTAPPCRPALDSPGGARRMERRWRR